MCRPGRWPSPAVVDDDSHGCSGRQSGQVQVHVFHPGRHFAHTQQLVQQHVQHWDGQTGREGRRCITVSSVSSAQPPGESCDLDLQILQPSSTSQLLK